MEEKWIELKKTTGLISEEISKSLYYMLFFIAKAQTIRPMKFWNNIFDHYHHSNNKCKCKIGKVISCCTISVDRDRDWDKIMEREKKKNLKLIDKIKYALEKYDVTYITKKEVEDCFNHHFHHFLYEGVEFIPTENIELSFRVRIYNIPALSKLENMVSKLKTHYSPCSFEYIIASIIQKNLYTKLRSMEKMEEKNEEIDNLIDSKDDYLLSHIYIKGKEEGNLSNTFLTKIEDECERYPEHYPILKDCIYLSDSYRKQKKVKFLI